MCFAYTNKIPTSVEELEKLSTDAFLQSTLRGQNVGQIAIAYTVWSKKKGGGKLIVKEAYVGKGLVMKRFHARARGRGAKIIKPFSHLTILLSEQEGK